MVQGWWPGCSDEVERLDRLAKVRVGNRDGTDCISATLGPISNQVGQSVGILDGGGHLDRTGHVVVGVAQLVGKLLDFFSGPTCGVIHDHVVCG